MIDKLLLDFVNKFNNFYLKTTEIKMIIGYLLCNYKTRPPDNEILKHSWFFKNIELGYVPTPVVLEDLIETIYDEKIIIKLYEMYPTKINPISIFTPVFFLKNIFNVYDLKKINEIFERFKVVKIDIEKLIKQNAFKIDSNHDKKEVRTYLYNMLNYLIENNIKLEMQNIFDLNNYGSNMLIELSSPQTEFEKGVVNSLKKIINKFNSVDLKNFLKNILGKTIYIKFILNILFMYIEFEKCDERTICELISEPSFSNLPFEYFSVIYDGPITKNIIYQLFLNKHFNFIKNFIKIIEMGEFNNSSTQETKFKIDMTLQEIFELSFEYCSIVLIEQFIKNKYVITEEMVLKNFSKDLFTILDFISKEGVYFTEKCFDHLVLNMSISNIPFSHKKIQNISIYINDEDEFMKFIPELKKKYEYYTFIKGHDFTEIKNVINFLKDKKVTDEMIILASSPSIRLYLFDRMKKEKKNVKKIIVKKIIKKSKNNNI